MIELEVERICGDKGLRFIDLGQKRRMHDRGDVLESDAGLVEGIDIEGEHPDWLGETDRHERQGDEHARLQDAAEDLEGGDAHGEEEGSHD